MDLQQFDIPGSRLRVVDLNELEAIELLTHDEYFEYEDLVYDAGGRHLRLPFRRIFHGIKGTEVAKGALSTISEVPVLRCCVIVEGVEKVTLSSWQGICSFEAWTYDPNLSQLTISFWMGLTATIGGTRLSVTYETIEFRGKGRIERGLLGVESTDGEVYE